MRKDGSGRITLEQPRKGLTRLPGRPSKAMLEPKRLPNINRVYMNQQPPHANKDVSPLKSYL